MQVRLDADDVAALIGAFAIAMEWYCDDAEYACVWEEELAVADRLRQALRLYNVPCNDALPAVLERSKRYVDHR